VIRRASLAFSVAVAAIAALPVAPTQADYLIDGHGYGHGVGMAQYGAYGYARDQQRSFRWILGHYYPGTRVAAVAAPRIRVRLKELSALRVSSADLATTAGRRVSLHSDRTYRFTPSADGVQVTDLRTGRVRAQLPAPVRLSPGRAALRLLGLAENGVRDGRYRGALYLHRDGDRMLAVDDVALEDYLLGVVGSEMPASWPREALRAQAVVARSFALTTRRPTQLFDVYADTRSQVYRGLAGEAVASRAAVRDTHGLGVLAGAQVATTFFHASSGGRTAAVQEVFAGAGPLPYLVSVEDPFDRLSPYHDWSVTLTDDQMSIRLAAAVPGELLDVAVAARTPTGRVAVLRVTGTLGTRDLDRPAARALLGLRSTWFTVMHGSGGTTGATADIGRMPAPGHGATLGL
jgi:stage II sporulation protein D